MFRFLLIFSFIFLCTLSTKAQEKPWYKPTRIGFMYGYGEQGGFLLNDKDYSYSTNQLKLQLYYPLREGKINLDLLIEPTIGFAKHQLLNFYFIEPDESNFLVKREEFTQSKLITEYILTANLIISTRLSNVSRISVIIGFGPMFISKRTERLAKGLAFADVIGLGFTTKLSQKVNFDIKGNLRHLSNAELRQPNSGINIASLEVGFSFKL